MNENNSFVCSNLLFEKFALGKMENSNNPSSETDKFSQHNLSGSTNSILMMDSWSTLLEQSKL